MPEFKVSFNKATKTAYVIPAAGAIPEGSVDVGNFNHPNESYPDSYVIYHGVRDLLYKRDANNPAQEAKFPNNIVDMQRININFDATRLVGVSLVPSVATLKVGAKLPLVVKTIPENAADKSGTFVSYDDALATVSNKGVVTAVKAGLCGIQFTSTDGGYTAVCNVTITA